MRPRPVLIAGPTASGKSGLALRLAEAHGGAIINADSQQIYRDWRLLTARPSITEEARVPHHLYATHDLVEAYSVGQWLRDLAAVLADCHTGGHRPIIVGGTGLYFKALTEGIAPIPETPSEIQAEIRARGEAALADQGAPAFTDAFARRDPATARGIDLANPARVLRAWEVLEATGKPLAQWHAETAPPLLALATCTAIVIAPEREALYAQCDARFDQMIDQGALAEVEAVMTRNPPPEAPGLKALGARELAAALAGDVPLTQAIAEAKMATRRYAKRQLTWGRNQMGTWHRIASPDADLPNL